MYPSLETHGKYAIGVPVTTQRPSSRRPATAETAPIAQPGDPAMAVIGALLDAGNELDELLDELPEKGKRDRAAQRRWAAASAKARRLANVLNGPKGGAPSDDTYTALEDYDLEGYQVGAPPMAPNYDFAVCANSLCGQCGAVGMDYRPFVRGESYRAFAVCPDCGHAEEF